MELSSSVIEGLKLLNGKIDEVITKKLVVNAVKQLLVTGPPLPVRSDIYDSAVSREAKQADFAVCAVLLVAAQHSIDVIVFRETLELLKLNNQTIEQLVESYDKFRDEIVIRLSKLGTSHNIPNLTNVSVEIQQKIPSNEFVYKLNLLSFDHQSGQNKIIQEIFCNQEELQSMINKLKDIERHCEKLGK